MCRILISVDTMPIVHCAAVVRLLQNTAGLCTWHDGDCSPQPVADEDLAAAAGRTPRHRGQRSTTTNRTMSTSQLLRLHTDTFCTVCLWSHSKHQLQSYRNFGPYRWSTNTMQWTRWSRYRWFMVCAAWWNYWTGEWWRWWMQPKHSDYFPLHHRRNRGLEPDCKHRVRHAGLPK